MHFHADDDFPIAGRTFQKFPGAWLNCHRVLTNFSAISASLQHVVAVHAPRPQAVIAVRRYVYGSDILAHLRFLVRKLNFIKLPDFCNDFRRIRGPFSSEPG
jgi:hypothetical protein